MPTMLRGARARRGIGARSRGASRARRGKPSQYMLDGPFMRRRTDSESSEPEQEENKAEIVTTPTVPPRFDPFAGISVAVAEDGLRTMNEFFSEKIKVRFLLEVVFVLLAGFFGEAQKQNSLSNEDMVSSVEYWFHRMKREDKFSNVIDSIRDWVLDIESLRREDTEILAAARSTPEEEKTASLPKPASSAPAEPIEEDLTLERKQEAATLIGSKYVKTGGKRGYQLKNEFSPTDGGPWSQICMKRAIVWTDRLRTGVKEGSIQKEDYNGHEITPEEWDRMGGTPFLYERFGPDRRSQYQYFSRNQRRLFKKILMGTIEDWELPVLPKKSKKASNREALEAELKEEPLKKKPRVVAADEPLPEQHEILDISNEDDWPTTEEIEEAEEPGALVIQPDAPALIKTAPEFICPECKGERDEYSVVCPICMRRGVGLEQEEASAPTVALGILPTPTLPDLPYQGNIAKLLKKLEDFYKKAWEAIPMHGDPHIIAPFWMNKLKIPAKKKEAFSEARKRNARMHLVALIKAGVFVVQSKQVFGQDVLDAGHVIIDVLSYEILDLLGLFFIDCSIYPGWKLYPSRDEFEAMGINPSKFERLIESCELLVGDQMQDFLSLRTSVWLGDDRRSVMPENEIVELKEQTKHAARIALFFNCLVGGLVWHDYQSAELLPGADSAEEQDLREMALDKASNYNSAFKKLNRAHVSKAFTLEQQCDKVNATFIQNLKNFMKNK